MTTEVNQNKVMVAENGAIALPEHIRRAAGLEWGDELVVVWSPPDTILVRKLSEVAADDDAFTLAMQTFDRALRTAGYETAEDIIELVREVKTEQVTDWSEET